jgi:hypothetical protein
MFQQPQHSNALPRIAQWIIVTLLAMLLLSGMREARIELRCGAACQQAVTGQEF